MKALEILKNINVWGYTEEVQQQIDEVINELEELNNRSCERCKKWIGNTPFKGFCYVTGSSVYIGVCNKYKQKDNK